MAKSVKKADTAPKAAAKPRKPAAKKADILQMANPVKADKLQMQTPASISHEQVAALAHRFWNERGRAHGHHEEDWFRAEELLRGKAS
ncbi:MAG: DUF2934 domain-containing protein [Terracidiphilus sp.]|jgi:hypothetical protein